MLSEKNLLVAMEEAARAALSEAADDEMEKCRIRFEEDMANHKREIVSRMVNQIQVIAHHNPGCTGIVIQINLNGGK